MSTPTKEMFLICDDASGAAPTSPCDRRATAVSRTPDAGAPGPDAGEPSFHPGRWVMVGWRCGSWEAGPALTREQTAAAINALLGPRALAGPCARCGASHHRYGVGGHPLCPDCRTAPPIF